MNKFKCEFISSKPTIIESMVDEKTQTKKMKVRVKWQHAGVINRNGRRYKKEILQREIDRLQQPVVEGAVYGASYHPKGAEAEIIDVSHIWNRLWMEEDGGCIGEITILPTRNGLDAMAIIDNGGRIGVSSRGTGTTTKTTENIDGKDITFEDINNDYKMYSPGDLVLTPSVPDAGIRAKLEKYADTYFSDEDEIENQTIDDSQNSNKMEYRRMENKDFKVFKTEDEYKSHVEEIEKGFIESDAFKDAVNKAVDESKNDWKQELANDLDEKIKKIETEREGMVEGIQKRSVC